VRGRQGQVKRARYVKKMSVRLFVIWKLFEILRKFLNPSKEGKEKWIYFMTSELDGHSQSFPFKGFLRKRKKKRPFLKKSTGSHLIEKPSLLFLLDFRLFLLSCRVPSIP